MGIVAAGPGQRHHRHVGRRVRRDRPAGARSARAASIRSVTRSRARWHVMGVTLAAGPVAALVPRSVRCGAGDALRSYDQLCEAAAGVPAGADGARWTPYLMGERTPHLDPHARAALVGLTASHTRGHVVRAILEGVAFSLQDYVRDLREMRRAGDARPARRRRRAIAAVAADPGRRLRPRRRDRRGGRRRGLRRGAPRRRRRRRVADGRRGLRRDRPGRQPGDAVDPDAVRRCGSATSLSPRVSPHLPGARNRACGGNAIQPHRLR